MITPELEKQIIAQLKNGDQKAMEPLFKLYHRGLLYFANQLIHNQEQAEDIVADTFSKVWQKNKDFERLASIRSFMYVTIKNACINHIRSTERKAASHKEILHLMSESEDGIDNKIIKAELVQRILSEVEDLSPRCQEIFKMIYLDGLKVREIASRLDITVDTVRVYKARGLHKIRTSLNEKGLLFLILGLNVL